METFKFYGSLKKFKKTRLYKTLRRLNDTMVAFHSIKNLRWIHLTLPYIVFVLIVIYCVHNQS